MLATISTLSKRNVTFKVCVYTCTLQRSLLKVQWRSDKRNNSILDKKLLQKLPRLPNAALWKEQWYEFLMRFFSHENVWLHLMIMLCNLTLDTCNNVHQTQKIRGVKDVKCPPLNAMKTNLNVVNFLGDSVIVWISWYKSIMFFRFVSKTDKVLKVSQHGYFYIN